MLSLSAAAGKIHRLKKWLSPARFLAGDHSGKNNGHFALSLSRLNLIYSQQPNFLATTLGGISHLVAAIFWG